LFRAVMGRGGDPSGIEIERTCLRARLRQVAIRATSLRWLRFLEWAGIAGMIVLVGRASAAGDEKSAAPAPAQPAPAAQPAPSSPPAPAADPTPPVAYDALFRLPNDDAPRPAGGAPLDRRRWEERFSAVRGELDGAKSSLAKAQSDLEALAHKTESWQMAAPGAQPTSENSPVSYKLRQDIRQYREDVGRAERRLRELEVEASLAGVPLEWREPVHADATPGTPGS
jgi:hypothetical protein